MDRDVQGTIKKLLTSQRLGVLATYSGQHPYATLVGFVASEDRRHIFFGTLRDTRKYRHILASSTVSLLIDNRSNRPDDFRDAEVLTVIGEATEVTGSEREKYLQLYLNKHPFLEDFVSDPNWALIRIEAKKHILVSRFQEVMEFELQ